LIHIEDKAGLVSLKGLMALSARNLATHGPATALATKYSQAGGNRQTHP